MARPRTRYRNEVKGRLSDPAYERLELYARLNGVSESRAIGDLLEMILCGVIGTVPALLVDNSHEPSVFGPKTVRAE